MSLVAEDPETEIAIDLDTQSLILPDGRRVTFPIDAFSKVCLLEGIDQLGYLMKHGPAVAAFEAALTVFGDAIGTGWRMAHEQIGEITYMVLPDNTFLRQTS